jgi:hypothetical protein
MVKTGGRLAQALSELELTGLTRSVGTADHRYYYCEDELELTGLTRSVGTADHRYYYCED